MLLVISYTGKKVLNIWEVLSNLFILQGYHITINVERITDIFLVDFTLSVPSEVAGLQPAIYDLSSLSFVR